MLFNLKPGVDIRGLKPEALLGLIMAKSVFDHCGQKFTVTSVCDGEHSPNSFHYHGLAFDLRIHDIRGISSRDMVSKLQQVLGLQFDIVLETDHIHVEFDPS